ncbi:hypothetical protein CVT24_010139 [Panaeolus cyanescens]|uniref:GST N-terminal domain-containing protein n=1 Tax=Panaeolus cyanescens TaxID=181874 RepID=A0A409W9I3_9AGAR|nr:hypothetical protein CVT24_010139 [Panaeolus cyanescens]
MSSSSNITFYDIALRPPLEKYCCSPNPWKTRYALNFKNLDYTTQWVPLPDVAKVRKSLNLPACRKFADGTDFYTLPIVQDASTGALVGDSFDIAVYLQKTYPDSGAGDLFPPQNLDYVLAQEFQILVPLTDARESPYPDYAKFNVNVDAAFTAHVVLGVQNFPFNPATEEADKAEFCRRAGRARFEDFEVAGEVREQIKASFKNTLGGLAELFQRDASGPFLLGTKPSYADLIVGAWLRNMYVTLPESEWAELRSWHDGTFGKLHDALEVFAKV